jgi:hypothetical protein
MAHSFDSGAAKPQRALLKDGVVSLLTPLKLVPGSPPTGGYLLDIIKFGGVVWSTQNDGPDLQTLMKTFARTPTVGVATGTLTAQTATVNKRHAIGQVELILFFGNQHGRDAHHGRLESDVTALANDQADPGLDVAMEHCRELLLGQWPTVLTSTVKQLEFRTEEEVVTLPTLTLWQQKYMVTLTHLVPNVGGEFRTAQQLLDSIHWRVTTESGEALPPAEATSPTSIDKHTDDLEP